jgi:hypothetical protein
MFYYMKSFDREILEKALGRLGELAEADGLTLELCIYG